MQQEIIITDVTRFKNNDILCVAGLTPNGQTCIRPLQEINNGTPKYLSYDTCKKNNVLPGMIICSEFRSSGRVSSPHIEDRLFTQLTKKGQCTSSQFEEILGNSASPSVAQGFGLSKILDKVLPTTVEILKSIITIEIDPKKISIDEDHYGSIKAHFTDQSGSSYRYLSITDLGFFDYVGNPKTRRVSASEITDFLHNQKRIFLRVGLSRPYTSPQGKHGYWMQINGIYSFPEYNQLVRSY